uniref:CSY2 n=1 Tax=Arundo donax TaxID=35708 RepID=A0A0A9E061_ARUDO
MTRVLRFTILAISILPQFAHPSATLMGMRESFATGDIQSKSCLKAVHLLRWHIS